MIKSYSLLDNLYKEKYIYEDAYSVDSNNCYFI